MKEIGIIVAMEEELEEVLNIMTDIEEENIYNLRIFKGKIKERKCIVVESGVGKVNAARTTQILINNFEIKYIINLGAGGSVNGLLNIGDIVIAKHIVQHDFDITAFRHSKGYITGVGDKIICDREIVDKLEKVVKAIPERNYQIKIGVIATGDIFCTDVGMKNKIHTKFDADAVDMEGGAIAQVCYLDGIPFVGIRCISDIPNGNNSKTSDENLKLASKRCANLLKEYLSY